MTTQATCAPHLDIFGNDAGLFTGTSPSAIGGNLHFYGDWGPFGVTKQTFFFPPWNFGISTQNVSQNAYASAWPWTVGTTSVTGVSLRTPGGGLTPGTITGMGSNNLTPLGSGTLSMVSPIHVEALDLGRAPTGVIAELTLVFAPEPTSLAMLSAGSALLAVLARRRLGNRPAREVGRSRGE